MLVTSKNKLFIKSNWDKNINFSQQELINIKNDIKDLNTTQTGQTINSDCCSKDENENCS